MFKFWGDNVEKKRRARDLRSDNQGSMIHMFSMIAGRSQTPAPELHHHMAKYLHEVPPVLSSSSPTPVMWQLLSK